MGCCTSRPEKVDEEEDKPLLDASVSDDICQRPISPKINEAEVWNEIINQAAESMINSSPTQPLHPTEIEDRRKKYSNVLNLLESNYCATVTFDQQANPFDLLNEAKPYEAVLELSDHISKINNAKKQINNSFIEHGPIVVHMKKLGRRS